MDQSESPQEYTEAELERLRRIEEELASIGETGLKDAHDPGLDEKLRSLEEQTLRAKRTFDSTKPENAIGGFVTKDTGRSLGLGLQVAYAIIGVPLVGFGIGYAIDQPTGGTLWRGLLTIVGAIVAVWYAIRSTSRA